MFIILLYSILLWPYVPCKNYQIFLRTTVHVQSSFNLTEKQRPFINQNTPHIRHSLLFPRLLNFIPERRVSGLFWRQDHLPEVMENQGV